MPNYTSNLNLYKWDKSDKKLDTITETASTMDKIDTALNNATNTANIAKTTADTAKSTADTAKSTADGIAATANSALTTANSATTTANNAVTTANSATTTANDAKTTANSVQSQFNQVVAEAGSNNPEVVQARSGEVNLNTRLDKFTSQLASKANQTDLNKATKNYTPLKAIEKFDDDLFNFDYTNGIEVIASSVAGKKQLTINSSTVENAHTNVAVYNAINNVRGYEVEFEPGSVGASEKLGFADDINNFIFLNFSSGEMFSVNNGVLETPALNTGYTPSPFVNGDRIKLVFNSNIIQLFKNDVLIKTVKPNNSYYASKMIRSIKNKYPAIAFRDGTVDYKYGVNKLKVVQNSYPKFMHFSVDDEIDTLRRLKETAPASIFTIENFAYMKYLHDTYGAVFTLNLFYRYTNGNTFTLTDIPTTYANEFRANADWLKFAFHGYDGVVNYSTLDTPTAKSHYDTIMTEIARFASPQNIDTMPRASSFGGTLNTVRAWRDTANYNITGLLSADDTRNSYYHTDVQRDALIDCDDLYDGVEKLFFMRTDLRMDSATNVYQTLDSRKTDPAYRGQQNAQIVFWHSSSIWPDNIKTNAEDCCKWARDNGYVFLYPMNVNPKF